MHAPHFRKELHKFVSLLMGGGEVDGWDCSFRRTPCMDSAVCCCVCQCEDGSEEEQESSADGFGHRTNLLRKPHVTVGIF